RRVDYDVAAELQLAKDLRLPYFEVYYESLVNGIHHTHHQEFLRELAQKEGCDRELDDRVRLANLSFWTLSYGRTCGPSI
ncbi:hypothetical protein, partial [Haemophilus influenzae]|uniref:hypothetical protein n=1 Tax=Haemophilus influenzae TaxID=727 RepID=UPI000CC27B1E